MLEKHRIELIELYPQMFTWSVWKEPNTFGKLYNNVLAILHKHFKFTRKINYISQPNPYNYHFAVGDGWYKLIKSLIIKIKKEDTKKNYITQVTQIKEKWGGLRFYTNGTSSKNWDYIHFAESKSHTICESCGAQSNVGILNTGWLTTKCIKCAKAEFEKKKSEGRLRDGFTFEDAWDYAKISKTIQTPKSKLKK
jgi:hypothetical protein